jgi:hypothetical protein
MILPEQGISSISKPSGGLQDFKKLDQFLAKLREPLIRYRCRFPDGVLCES